MKKFYVILFFAFFVVSVSFAQQKKPIDFSLYDTWNTTKNQSITDDGKWVTYEVNPYKGDGKLIVMNPNRLEKKVFQRGTKAVFSPSSKYIAFTVVPQEDSIRKLKLKKVKRDKMPKDSLKVWVFKSNKLFNINELKSYELPKEKSEWMAYTQTPKPSSDKKEKRKKVKGAPAIYDLVIVNPVKDIEYRFKNVTEFTVSRNGKLIGFIQVDPYSSSHSKVSVFDTEEENIQKIFDRKGIAKKISLDNSGKQSSFIFSADSTSTKIYSLYYWASDKTISSEIVIDTNSLKMPKDWVVSENRPIWFSRDDSKMYFGTALKPMPQKKDTLLEEEKVKLDVWAWTDPLLQSQQLVELKREQRRTYLTVFHPREKTVARLADERVTDVATLQHGNLDIALGVTGKDFMKERSWKYPWTRDYYLIDVKTGNKRIVLEKNNNEFGMSPFGQFNVGISPFGKYIFWFDREKQAWLVKDTKTFKVRNITKGIKTNFFEEDHDRPYDAPAYGYAGWTKDDKYFLVYDRYDIWQVDPSGNEAPINITDETGKRNQLQFRYLKLDKDDVYIDITNNLFLSVFNVKNKQSGFYSLSLNKKKELKRLILDNYRFYPPIKAKNAERLLWMAGSIKEYPDLWYSSIELKDPLKISNVNPQQEKYNWATAELVKWKTFDGKIAEGILYKPEDFELGQKYPMIVYFYERKSDDLHRHFYPYPSRGSLNPLMYASNGYLVFIPNIRYEIGIPGKSAYNYVVSGTKAMIEKGIVEEDKIGIQGQSWGGYQASFIITQTNLFKAASVGAPVANMTNGYTSIYWKYGLSRMSVYESDQSRIGATLWEKPELYFKNSPIFYADKIETPLLIRHNDGDGAVPWQQGIQLFVALRRLNKPVWLLNYNGEPHNLRSKSPNTKDFSKRMFQFFNHYLKGKPAPEWLIKGIPALKKGKTLGYGLIEDKREVRVN